MSDLSCTLALYFISLSTDLFMCSITGSCTVKGFIGLLGQAFFLYFDDFDQRISITL